MNIDHLVKSIENLALLEIDLRSIHDPEKSRLYCTLLTLAGVTGFSVNLDQVDDFLTGIKDAKRFTSSSGKIIHDPYIKVTITLDHTLELGTENLHKVKETIKTAVDKEIHILELSPRNTDEEVFKDILDFLNDISEHQLLSLHSNRTYRSNAHLVNRTKDAFDKFGSRLLLNVDGASKTNGKDSYDQTIQTIATADILIKDLKVKERRKYKKLPVYLSGDINKKTTGLAKLCGIDYCGLSVTADIIASLDVLDHSMKIENFSDIEGHLTDIIEELEYFRNLDRKDEW